MKHQLLFIILCFTFFNSFSQYAVNGNAMSESCRCYQLTAPVNGQSGSVWNTNQINLSQAFDFKFDFFLGCNDSPGADGMAFVLQPLSTTVGSSGGGMGYQGITPSLGILLDTYQNGGDADPFYDHISININGIINHSTASNLAGPTQIINGVNNAEDCTWHELRVTWNPSTQLITAYVDGVQRVQATINLITNIFSGNPNVFWGFTAATGGENNFHKFCVKNTPAITQNITSDTICTQTASVTYVGQGVSASSLPISEHYWNMGDGTTYTTQNITHTLLAGSIYNIKYVSKTIDGCWSDTARKTITVARFPTTSLSVADICVGDTVFFNSSYTLNQIDGTPTHHYAIDNIPVSTFINNAPYAINLTPGTHNAAYYITTSYGCTTNIATDAFQVFPKPNNTTIIANDGCEGSPILISSGTNDATLTYEWYINGIASGTANSIMPNLMAGTYLIKHLVKNNNGCKSDTATRTITIHPKPIAIAVINDTCLGNPVLFNSINSNANFTYNWIVNGIPLSQTVSSFTQAYPLGTYSVKHYITGLGGCVSDTAFDNFTVLAKPNTPSATVFDLCQNQNANFTITNPIANNLYYWIIDNAMPLQALNITNSFAPGMHTIKLIATNGASCVSDTAYYNFNVAASASAQFIINDECGEKSITIQGAVALQHQWLVNGMLESNAQNFTRMYTAGSYTIRHIVGNGNLNCNDTVTKSFTVYKKPQISAGAPTVCEGQPSVFTANILNGPIANLNYYWIFPNGINSSTNTPSVSLPLGNYTARLVVNNTSACPSDTTPIQFTVIKPFVFAGNDTIVPRNQAFSLVGTGANGNISWSPSSVFTSGINTLTPTGVLANDQKVVLTIVTPECTVSDTLQISVFDDARIFVPSAFSPNRDGVNDVFLPKYYGIKQLNYFSVYNRWGKIIFTTKKLNEGWNGSFQGKLQPLQTYVWMIEAVDFFGKIHRLKGTTIAVF